MKANFRRVLARSCPDAGFSIIESAVALAIAGASLGAVMLVNSQQLKLVRSSRETNAASLCVEDRVEQIRIASNWNELTNAAYLQGTFFSNGLKSAGPLGVYTERIAVKAYRQGDNGPALIVEKRKGQPARVVADGSGLDALHLAEVDVQLRWQSADGRVRTTQCVTVISERNQ